MANKDDYLTEYRCFFENFAQTYNPHDQLPVKLGSYKLASFEVVGGIIDWTTQYLNQKKCPQSLLSPLIKIIIEEVRGLCRKQTLACGFNPSSNAYDPLRLMQCVVTKTNEICLRYLDNSKLCSLPSPGPPYNTVSVCAIKNNRRRMEDRHVVIHDLNTLFIDEEVSPSSYYAIFDGHAGHDAAAYSCAHLHQFLGESKYFITNPEQALREAFLKTDTLFNDKCNLENFRSGTTALCVLLKHKEKTLYIGWVGDSQAVLVSQGQCIQCVQPHKPCREDEKNRIEQEGGTVIYWGTWRVNGQLAVSRAIGDVEYKPYVTAVPDIIEIPLSGVEDFLILACDGLWDVISEKDAARHVYEEIIQNPGDIESVSQHLVQLAKEKGSCDNISVIVVFLREPSKVAAEAHWATRHSIIMDTLDNANATNPFANSNNGDIMQKEEYVMNIGEGFKQNGTEALEFLKATNGKRTSHEFDEDDDLGPETDVDTIDDVLLTTTVLSAKNLMEEIVNNNSSLCEKEKATLETDTDVAEKQSVDEFENIQSFRDETPTPPAELVQDGSGLVDNVAESGEDSEDEWNYIKGDQAEKENIDPSQSDKEVCELTSDLDTENMSQLNPNAAEFVPISPKRTTASPPYEKIMDDIVIAQSPKRGPNNDYDINLPNLQEFETEIKMRPSDVEESAEDDETNNAATLSSQEIMENLLNGKSIEEIEFQPNSTPIKFHFGPNSTGFVAPGGFMDQSEVLSTKAVIGDDSNYMEDTQLDTSCNLNESDDMMKDEDPMSMSFYQDKEDTENNPFDLNKVQVLPENIDDFLEKPKEEEANSLMDTTISDLPEHNPLEPENPTKSPVLQEIYNDVVVEREVSFSPVELQQAVSPVPVESPLPQSQLIIDDRELIPEVLESHPVTLEPISPVSPTRTPELSYEVSPRLQSPTLVIDEREQPSPITAEDDQRPQSSDLDIHEHRLDSPIVDLDEPEEAQPVLDIQEPICTAQSPVPDLLHSLTNEQEQKTQSLLENKFEFEEQSSFVELQSSNLVSEPVVEEMVCGIAQSPKLLGESPLSPPPQIPKSPSPIPTAQSPVPAALSPVPAAESPVPTAQSPIPAAQSPIPTAQSPIPAAQSPIPAAHSPIPTAQSPVPIPQSPVLAAQSPIHIPQELDSPIDDVTSSVKDSPLPESPTEKPSADGLLCDVNSDDAFINHETESVTTDVNSFLERSLVPDMASPLSGDEVQAVGASNEYVEIKSETIAPEFPVEIVTTPSEESKTEELQSDENKIAVAAVAATAAAVAVTAAAVPSVAEKKPISKPKTTTAAKKPLSKPSPTKAPSKPLAAKPPTTSKPIAKAAPAKPLTATSKVSTVGKTTPKEKMSIPSKTAEKKPLLNGDAGKTLVKKSASNPTPLKASPATKTVPAKVSSTRTAFESKATRPATAPPPSTTGRLTAKTARPTTVAPKTTTAKSTTSTTPTKATTATPKPKTTLSPKPKPLAPDTKKQIKETTNKQLTSTTNKPLSTVGKTTSKSVGSTLTKTTAGKVDDKKPTELVRHAAKPKTTTGIVKKTKTVTNGVATKVTTTTTITEKTLIKDVSPVVENNMIDNSQIIETNNIAD